jgi:hypothetical protein
MNELDKIIKYKSIDGNVSFEVNLEEETVWLTQKQMAELFDRGIPAINEHTKNIFKENELLEESVIRKFRITAKDGKGYDTKHYNLDVIISIGYRVNSKRGTHFRQWATQILKAYMEKGYAINTKRLIEKKLELEIRESSKMVEQIFLLKGIGKNSDSEDVITTVSTYLGKTLDQETMILKAHILTERFLIQYLKKVSKNSKIYEDERFTYKHLLSISKAYHAPEEKLWLWELLSKLNKIRNSFAHTLENEELKEQVQEFIRISKVRLEKENFSIPKETVALKTILVHFCGAVYAGII